MKYIETKDGKIYKVIHENFGIDAGHYVCSALDSYNVIVKCGNEEKRIEDCHGLVFIDKSDVLREYDYITEEDGK